MLAIRRSYFVRASTPSPHDRLTPLGHSFWGPLGTSEDGPSPDQTLPRKLTVSRRKHQKKTKLSQSKFISRRYCKPFASYTWQRQLEISKQATWKRTRQSIVQNKRWRMSSSSWNNRLDSICGIRQWKPSALYGEELQEGGLTLVVIDVMGWKGASYAQYSHYKWGLWTW